MNGIEAVRKVLSEAGIEIGSDDKLIPFTHEGNSLFDFIRYSEGDGLFILELNVKNAAYVTAQDLLYQSSLRVYFYGSFMFGNRIAVISL